MAVFPLYVYDPQDPTYLVVIDSLEEAEAGGIEEFDVIDENFVIWDSAGVRLRATVKRQGGHWLELTPTGAEDMSGLREAIRAYAMAVGVPPEDVARLSPADAVTKLGEAEERQRGPRRWWQFWR